MKYYCVSVVGGERGLFEDMFLARSNERTQLKTMRNAFFWDIITQFLPHRRHTHYVSEEWRLLECYALWLL
jgi:hypothetical protein